MCSALANLPTAHRLVVVVLFVFRFWRKSIQTDTTSTWPYLVSAHLANPFPSSYFRKSCVHDITIVDFPVPRDRHHPPSSGVARACPSLKPMSGGATLRVDHSSNSVRSPVAKRHYCRPGKEIERSLNRGMGVTIWPGGGEPCIAGNAGVMMRPPRVSRP